MTAILIKRSQQGTILILTLWALGLLTVFAIAIGFKIQQKIILASRLGKRAQLYYAAEAGVKKSIALLKKEGGQNKVISKISLFNNPDLFQAVPVGSFVFDVSSGKTYGLVDEERKLNVNTADQPAVASLLREVLDVGEETAEDFADAIIDWRTLGESGISSFFSEEYYDNLRFPYKEKKGNFETLDELLLVKGITPAIYQKILPFVTIYGNGKVNVNSAPQEVLMALGISGSIANKIVLGRRGTDGEEATADDIIFPPGQDMIRLLYDLVKEEQEKDDQEKMTQLSELFVKRKIGGESSFFMIQSHGYPKPLAEASAELASPDDAPQGRQKKNITCVFDLNSGKIKYWREE